MRFQYLGSLPEFNMVKGYKGSQAPTVRRVKQTDRYEIWFSARDDRKQSHPFKYVINKSDPTKVICIETKPLIQLGKAGEPDEHGVMPSGFYPYSDYLHYTGWNRGIEGSDARYRTASMYINLDTGEKGVICDRHTNAICGTSMPHTAGDEGFVMMSYTGWNSDKEPIYGISYYDGEYDDLHPIETLSKDKCQARPVPIKIKGSGYYIFFSERGQSNYRIDSSEMYKLVAYKAYGKDKGVISSIEVISDPAPMKAYAYPIYIDKKLYIFYNRGWNQDGFTSAIGVAVLYD